jgi:hypothetical protein
MAHPFRLDRVLLVAIAAAAVLLCTPNLLRAQSDQPASVPQERPAAVPPGIGGELEPGRAAPILLGGEPVVWITAGIGQYTVDTRAARITQRLGEVVHDRSIRDVMVTVTEAGNSSELRVQGRLLMVVTEQDARIMGVSRIGLAEETARLFEAAIRAERYRYAPATLTRNAWQAALALLAVIAALWALLRVLRWARIRIERWWERWLLAKGARRLGEQRVRHLVRTAGRLVFLLHAGVPAGRPRQGRRHLRGHCRHHAARHENPHDQERGDHHPQRHRARQLGHELLPAGERARPHPPHQRDHRL